MSETEDVIKTWLETNFAEALKKGDDAVVEFRAQVAAMGPEVVAVLQGIEGTTATVSASVGESLATMSVKLDEATGQGEGESGQGGFKGMASGVMKAEKAIHSLASGSGLGRLGSMLEGVLGPMGVPGLGMALGALAYELEPLIPKIRAFVDAWEMGVKPLTETAEAIERLNRAQGETRQKRALGRITSKITALEDEEDTQGWLAPDKQAQLRDLRRAASDMQQQFDWDKAAEERRKREEKNKRETEESVRFAADWAHELDVEAQKSAHQQLEARRKRVEHAQRVEDEGIIEQANEADRAEKDAARGADRQQRDAGRAAAQGQRQADREAAQAARENTPERLKQRAIGEEIERQGGATADPDFVRQVAAQASRNVTMGADIATAVMYAVQQTEARILAEFSRGMEQQYRSYQLNGSRY